MLRHLVLADAAAVLRERGDHHLGNVVFSMAYGYYPFCVHEDRNGSILVFRCRMEFFFPFGHTRRVVIPADKEKDRARRLTEAIEALQQLEGLNWYHSTLTDGNQQLHVEPSHAVPVVHWTIGNPSVEAHVRVIPDETDVRDAHQFPVPISFDGPSGMFKNTPGKISSASWMNRSPRPTQCPDTFAWLKSSILWEGAPVRRDTPTNAVWPCANRRQTSCLSGSCTSTSRRGR